MFILEFDYNLLLLVFVGFIAGFVNTIAGGGSLLTLPVLIFLGLPPSIANGTNRIGVFLQTLTGAVGYKSKGITTFPFSIYCGATALVGSLIGAQIAIDIKGETFNRILAIIMILVVMLIVFKRHFIAKGFVERIQGKHLWISMIVFFFLGIYGGFINAGIGFVLLLFLQYFNGMSLVKANATKVTIACIYTGAAIVLFALNDKINWTYGFFLASGNMVGAWISSRLAVRKGDNYIRIFLIIMVSLMAFKLWFFQ
ncbi:MAG: sulfite exporter TauE/SafE family protein [Flavobacteriaceae bacterium]|nr:sulfite exporter TauE/SafE family protein [Flavobacteriaceae bacterium]